MLPDVGHAADCAAQPACGPHHVAAHPDRAGDPRHQRCQASVAVRAGLGHGDARLGADPPRKVHVVAGAIHPPGTDSFLGQVQERRYALAAYVRDGVLRDAPLAHGALGARYVPCSYRCRARSREGHRPEEVADVLLLSLELVVGLRVGLPEEHEVLVEGPDRLVPGRLRDVDTQILVD